MHKPLLKYDMKTKQTYNLVSSLTCRPKILAFEDIEKRINILKSASFTVYNIV